MPEDKIPLSKKIRIGTLMDRKILMINYLQMKVAEKDWHGVQDAASDLRDIESEIKGLEFRV